MPAKGDGITKRKDGRYMARYTVQTPDGPKRKLIYGRKYKEVEKKLAEARGDAARGIVFDAKGETVGAFLERWLEHVVKPGKTHRTYTTHRQQVRSHIVPALGRVKLEALRKAQVDRLYADLLRAKPEGAGLAPSSVRRVHAVLHAALEEAVRGDLIPRNPCRPRKQAEGQARGDRAPRRLTSRRVTGGRSREPLRGPLRPVPHVRAPARRSAWAQVVGYRPGR